MNKIFKRIFLVYVFLYTFVYPYVIEKIISREHPFFKVNEASFTLGKDGNIYFFNPVPKRWDGFIYKVSKDGKEKKGISVGYGGTVNATANKDGIIGEASAHFRHTVTIYDMNFQKLYEISDFLVNDSVGWDSPGHIEAGESGDFYALDQNRSRILRISPNGKIVRIYQIPKVENAKCYDFRVCENKKLFYLSYWGRPLICVDFEGNKNWEYSISGNWDVDEKGNLYFIQPYSDTVEVISPDGKPSHKIKLKIEKTSEPLKKSFIKGLRIFNEEIFLRRYSDTTLFEIYNLKTGEFVKSIESEYEKIKVEFPSLIWATGEKIKLKIDFISNSENRILSPNFQIYIRPIEYNEYVPLIKQGDEVSVPKINPGFYFLLITPDLTPNYQSDFEYSLFVPIFLKEKNSSGVISIYTPSNRVFYGKGESINFYLKIRGNIPTQSLKLKFYQIENLLESNLICEEEINLRGIESYQFQIPSQVTEVMNPGVYLLKTEYPGFTNIGQIIVIGDKRIKRDEEFKIINYGDYGLTFPRTGNINFVFLSIPSIYNHVERSRKIGVNLFVDRVGYPVCFYALKWEPGWGEKNIFDEIKKAMKEEENLDIEEKTEILPPFFQVLSVYSAFGIKEMSILLGNDAGLPLGTGFDNRKPEELLKTIEEETKNFSVFPSFRGWIWASNWWVFGDRGGSVLKTPEEREKYNIALKEAKENGKWDKILEKAADLRLGYAVDAIKMFNEKLEEISYDLKTAVACPYRNVESYPPVTMREVEECDLQAQWEQIPPPYYAPLNVDFYKRPGKKDLSHPEIWNDSGTGEQITTTLFSMIMRGAESVGNSGSVLPWGNLKRDKRSSYYGTVSIYRVFYNLMKEYGPWLTKIKNSDKIAILADGRMYKIDDWGNIMGVHFARVFEGYLTCLFSHKPATIIFSDDVKKDTFKNYKAVLIIDQKVEFEDNVLAALKEAQKDGVKIYYDQTCNKNIIKDFIPLEIGFDKIEKDPSLHSDDSAYWRVKNYIFSNLPYIRKIFQDFESEVEIEEPEVFISEKIGEKGKYIFILNCKNADIGPEFLWRFSINVATTLPLKIPLKFKNYKGNYIYDITNMGEVKVDEEGKIECDLRTIPFRIYAIFPQKIEKVEVSYPSVVYKGSKLNIKTRVIDEKNNVIKGIIPVRFAIEDEKGKEIYSESGYVDSKGGNFEFILPFNLLTSKIKVNVTELITGKKCEADIDLLPLNEKFSIFKRIDITKGTKEEKIKRGDEYDRRFLSMERRFGPHIKDFTFNSDKTKLLINTMNWDTNLYCFDLKENKILWSKKIGHWFAFSPERFGNNFIVEGFDLYSTEGYHLYLLDENKGEIIRKFAFFGIPQRLCHRFVPGIINDNFDQWCSSEDGLYIGVSGNFGIVVWDKDGNLLWKKEWWDKERYVPCISFSEGFLIVGEKNKLYAVDIKNKKIQWENDLIPKGKIKDIRINKNLIAVYSETDKGGVIFIFKNNGDNIAKFYTSAEEICFSPDGKWIGVIKDNQLKIFSLNEGFKWSFSGDDILEGISFSPNSQNICVSSILGSFYVININGEKISEKDIGVKNIGKWINDKECLIVSWMGDIYRYSENKLVHLIKLSPTSEIEKVKFEKENLPSIREKSWGNSVKTKFSISDNVFNKNNVIIHFIGKGNPAAPNENYAEIRNKEMMVDGNPLPPDTPYIPWTFVNWMAETMPFGYLLFDGFNTIYKISGITIFEDPQHPEFWLKDAIFEYWDEENNRWVFVDYIVSEDGIHTHIFKEPVYSSKFRIVMPSNFYSNLKFGEICFHGERITCSHPDVIKKKNFVTLFDEDDLNYWREHFYPPNLIEFGYQNPVSGEKYLIIKSGLQGPIYRPPFGHSMRNWNFKIVEKPEKEDEFRYLQFYWKKLKPETKNFSLIFNGFSFYAGEYKGPNWYKTMKISDEIPTDWKLERIDLWKFLGKETNLTSISFITDGEIALDQIVLGKDEMVLDQLKEKNLTKFK